MALEIVQIPVLNDNYVYLLREPASGAVGVGDPPQPEPVLAALFGLNTGRFLLADKTGLLVKGTKPIQPAFNRIVKGPVFMRPAAVIFLQPQRIQGPAAKQGEAKFRARSQQICINRAQKTRRNPNLIPQI
ncbi:MAG: hypothetical protein VW600_21085, partial [Ferrovibrio sp.]